MTDVTLETARRRSFHGKLWALIWPYFRSADWKIAALLVIAIIAMNQSIVYVNVLLNDWNRDFFNALQDKSSEAYYALIWTYVKIIGVAILIVAYYLYLRQMLQIRWRKWMSETLIDSWMAERRFYQLELTGRGADNPEQRIEADIDQFVGQTITLSLSLLGAVVTLITFSIRLWGISGPVAFDLFGLHIVIPGYMFWVALAYAVFGTLVTHYLGRILSPINFALQRLNAEFRYRMTRIRENAEEIALYKGAEAEGRKLKEAFALIAGKWTHLMKTQKRLTFFTASFDYLADIFPLIVGAPRYFSGALQLGDLTQMAGAFGRVQGTLSWFVGAYPTLMEWKASVDRLTGFVDALETARGKTNGGPGIVHETQSGTTLAVAGLNLALPDGRILIENFSAQVASGDKLLITGPSGSGKTTLFRALAGLWPFGSGSVRSPEGAKALFLPQRPYLPIGTLRQALAYPAKAEDYADDALKAVLRDVKLAHLAERLDEDGNWSMALSVGERQRLAIARALLLKPDWLFLDEATAALDEANEQLMYGLIAERLPGVTLLSIAHRPAVARYHKARLTISPETRSASLSPLPA